MRSSNPVFSRAEGFNGRGNASGMTYPGQSGAPQAPQYAPQGGTQPSYGGPQAPVDYDRSRGVMTIDSVVQKTGISLGIVVLVAAATWFLTGPIDSQAALNTLYMLSHVRRASAASRCRWSTRSSSVISPASGDRLRRGRGSLRRRVQQGDGGSGSVTVTRAS